MAAVASYVIIAILAYLYGHIAEYFIHKFVLHSYGLRKSSPLSFHFEEHHRNARKNDFIDPSYNSVVPGWDAAGKEIFYLILTLLLHIPIYFVSNIFYIVLALSAIEYYYKHRRAHTNADWAMNNIPWHYDHHMGRNQHFNWGVRSDILDRLLKTRD